MITINTDGLTEISGGRNRKLNFVFKVTDDAVKILVADAAKVRYRSKYRKATETMVDGQYVTVMFDTEGDKLRMTMVDERELRRKELMDVITSDVSPEEILAAATELKSLL
jgi:hypothetical protein